MLINILGDRGSGKTMLATYIAIKENCEIFGNYTLKLPRFHALTPDMLDQELGYRTLNLIDEANAWLESRTSSKSIDLFLSKILFQSRKDKKDFILTYQDETSIDKRFRTGMDYLILATRRDDDFKEGDFIYDIFKRSVTRPRVKRFEISYEDAITHIAPYYDTEEKVPMDPELKFKAVQDKSIFIPEIDEILELDYFKKISLKEFTISHCNNWGIENHKSKDFMRMVYDRKRAKGVKL